MEKHLYVKSFKNIFLVFANGAVDKYAWVGAGTAEIIPSNDFCWCSEIIEQKDNFAKDLSIAKDSPVFATQINEIHLIGKHSSPNESEDDIMRSCWKLIKFLRNISELDQKVTPPCAKCFANFVFLESIE